MKVAIFSDTHDNTENVEKLIKKLNREEIEYAFHCGDIVSPFTLKMFKDLKCKLFVVFGNNDGDKFNLLKSKPENVKIFNLFGAVELEKKKIAFTHYDFFAIALAFTKKYDYVFFGHTHKKAKMKIGKTVLINPGEILGYFGEPSYAILDLKTGKVEFKLL